MTPASFLGAFAQALLRREFGRAEGMLSPWIRASLPPGGLKYVAQRALADAPPPAEFALEAMTYETLASMRDHVDEYAEADETRTLATTDGSIGEFGPPSYPLPAEVTAANFRGCWRVEFQPDEDLDVDDDFSYALFVAVVGENDVLAIGYLEPSD
ncbi:MAG: hypothetical protein ABJE47_08275 [bacterium]